MQFSSFLLESSRWPRGNRGAQACHYLSTSDTSFDQRPILRTGFGRQLYDLRKHELEITEQFCTLGIVTRGRVEQQPRIRQQIARPFRELSIHLCVTRISSERRQQSLGVRQMPDRGDLVGDFLPPSCNGARSRWIYAGVGAARVAPGAAAAKRVAVRDTIPTRRSSACEAGT